MKELNVISPVNQLGYGIVSLNILKAAIKAGYKVAWWPLGNSDAPTRDHNTLRQLYDNEKSFNKNAPCLRIWHQFDMAQMVGKGIHAGLPIFELDRFSEQERHHLGSLDVIFSPSKWGAEILKNNGLKHVVVAPFGVDTSIFNQEPPANGVAVNNGIDEFEPSLPDVTTFLNIGKWEIRKGHDVLVKAFNLAFNPQDRVRLVLNCDNPFIGNENSQWAGTYLNSRMGRANKITVMAKRLPEQENVAALIHKCDVGVFPTRAEGWNLDLLEMMACGKHVICTNYSAHTEFASKANASLIEMDELEAAYDGKWFTGQGNWAKFGSKQMEQLVEHMRTAHRMKQAVRLTANSEGMETAKRFTWENTFSSIEKALHG